MLRDVAEGTCSVLEHGYLTRVEGPHGLPTGIRQASHVGSSGSVYRDVAYAGLTLYVELDGGEDRRDMQRLGWESPPT